MGIRRKAREVALQALYQAELSGRDPVADFTLLCKNFDVAKKAIPYATLLLEGVCSHRSELDEIIHLNAKNWRLDRMSIIDRSLIRIGAYELLYQDDVPASVAINESIEIAKRFSTDDSSSFINGILDSISNGKR